FCLLLLCLAAAGCGRPAAVATHPVSGQVLYEGKPAAGGLGYLFPITAPTVPTIPMNPSGKTGADGRFTLTTYTSGDGAREGSYKVILLWPDESAEEEATVDRLLGWYDAVHTKLAARVKAGNNSLDPFQLPAVTRPPEAVAGVPGRN